MLICRCEDVHRFQILQAIAEGARTVADIARACGAGRRCGTCRGAIRKLLEGAQPAQPRFVSYLAVATALRSAGRGGAEAMAAAADSR